VTASSDKTAKLWDLKIGEVVLEYIGQHHKQLQQLLSMIVLNKS